MNNELAIIIKDLEFISDNLAESLHLDDIIYSCLEKQILPLQLYDEFMNPIHSDTSRALRLIKTIAKNPHTINDFLNALLKEGLDEIAGHISPTIVDSFLPSITNNGVTAQRLPHISPSPVSSTTPHQRMGPESSPSFTTINDNYFLNIKVKSSHCKYGSEKNNKDIYKNSSSPQGFLFLVNFDCFDNNTYKPRVGSDIDVKNLQELFIQVGYAVVGPYINLTKFELIRAIEKFCSDEALEDIDSCIIAIMSHGKGDMAFLTSDNKVLTYLEILELFNNKGCPALFGKPKVFIFQSCRGAVADEGVGMVPKLVSHSRESCTDAAFIGTSLPVSSSPSFTDMYIIHSSLEGFVSYRCPNRGSWLIEALCIEFMGNAYNKDLEALMRLVSRRLKLVYSDKGKKQICEIRNVGFDKQLYFNPISTPDL